MSDHIRRAVDLHYAIRRGDKTSVCQGLESATHDPDLKECLRNDWDKYLFDAVGHPQADILRALLQWGKGHGVYSKNRLGTTLVHAVVQNNSKNQCVEILLEYGAYARHNDSEALTEAIFKKRWDIAALLLEKGADPNADDHELLARTIFFNHLPTVMLLLRHGANQNSCTKALRMASATRTQEAFDLLYPLADPETALQDMYGNGITPDKLMLHERVHADRARRQLHDTLSKETTSKETTGVAPTCPSKSSKKM